MKYCCQVVDWDAKNKPSLNEVKTNEKEKDKKTEDNEADLGTLNSNWMLINGLISPQYSGAVYEDSRESSSVFVGPSQTYQHYPLMIVSLNCDTTYETNSATGDQATSSHTDNFKYVFKYLNQPCLNYNSPVSLTCAQLQFRPWQTRERKCALRIGL